MNLTYRFNKGSAPERPKSLAYHDTDAHVRNVCFVPSDGTMLLLSYAFLISAAFAPEENAIMLSFSTHTVMLKGKNLSALFESLAAHRPKRITAVEERYAATEEQTETVVTQIDVQSL